ncbi:MAG: penicillin-binding transpeptidase domain-containing protein [Butyricicoccus sp.]
MYDRDGSALNYSNKIGGVRHYTGGRAYSTLTGFYSKIYGSMGVEKTFNTDLVSSRSRGDEKKGCDIVLTTDSDLQQAAYDAISDIANGAAVVLDTNTGEILAMASTPTYEPDSLEENWESLCEVDGLFLPNAYKSTFAPGSDFKIISACAVIDNNVDSETVMDNGSLTFKNGQTITNYRGNAYGELDLDGAIVNSSNVYFMEKALEMGGDALEQSIRKFLIGEDIHLDFTTLKSKLDFEDYRDEVVASIAFGQGQTEVSPLQMAMVAQAIANDGVMLKPYLVQSVTEASGNVKQEGSTEELATVTSKSTADRVTSAMTLAADRYGFSYIGPEGWDVAAKTGTAETGKGDYNGWIVTFAPSESPKYAVVVMAASQDHDGIYYKYAVDQIYDALVDYDNSRSSSSADSDDE